VSQGESESSEKGNAEVVIIVARHFPQVKRNARVARQSTEELLDRLRRQIANPFSLERNVPKQVSASADVDGDEDKGIVHRSVNAAVASDLLFLVERLVDGLPQHDSDIFNEVVLVHFKIALGANSKVDLAVESELL
jgi:hypothetical protein